MASAFLRQRKGKEKREKGKKEKEKEKEKEQKLHHPDLARAGTSVLRLLCCVFQFEVQDGPDASHAVKSV
jgi:hypothetical protein